MAAATRSTASQFPDPHRCQRWPCPAAPSRASLTLGTSRARGAASLCCNRPGIPHDRLETQRRHRGDGPIKSSDEPPVSRPRELAVLCRTAVSSAATLLVARNQPRKPTRVERRGNIRYDIASIPTRPKLRPASEGGCSVVTQSSFSDLLGSCFPGDVRRRGLLSDARRAASATE